MFESVPGAELATDKFNQIQECIVELIVLEVDRPIIVILAPHGPDSAKPNPQLFMW